MNDDLKIFFARSKLRQTVLTELNNKGQYASFLSKHLNKHREVISRVFLDLQDKGLAKCTNPEKPHFRKYQITKKGKEALNFLRTI